MIVEPASSVGCGTEQIRVVFDHRQFHRIVVFVAVLWDWCSFYSKITFHLCLLSCDEPAIKSFR